MNPLAWLIGLFMPVWGGTGAQGLPPPAYMDIAHIERPSSPNTALAAPADFKPPPDIATPVYRLPAQKLYAAIRAVVLAQPRTFLHAEYADRGQLHLVVRSMVLNFPDLVTIQVTPAGDAASTLLIYSRSVYGEGDLGVNKRRVRAWLAALDQSLPPSQQE